MDAAFSKSWYVAPFNETYLASSQLEGYWICSLLTKYDGPGVGHLTPKIASSSNPRPLPGLPLPFLQINIDSCIIQCYPSVAARTVTTALIYLLFNISSIKLLMCIEASTTYRTGGWSRRIFTRGQTVTAESECERQKKYQFPQKKGYTS